MLNFNRGEMLTSCPGHFTLRKGLPTFIAYEDMDESQSQYGGWEEEKKVKLSP
jgi:hypothetical protein